MEALWTVFCFFYIFTVRSANEALRASIAITNLKILNVSIFTAIFRLRNRWCYAFPDNLLTENQSEHQKCNTQS